MADLTDVGRLGVMLGLTACGALAASLVLGGSQFLGGSQRPSRPVDHAIRPALAQPRAVTSAGAQLSVGTVTRAVAGQGYDVDATGFARSADVDLELADSPWQGSTRADLFGRVAVRFVVPTDLPAGSYQLSLTGPGAASDPTGQVARIAAVAIDHAAAGPRVEIFRFTVV
jgi:hypothetical protein